MPRLRMLVDICRLCGGWCSIGSTVDDGDLTEYPTTITIRIANDHDLGEYADPKIGGCRCYGYHRHDHPHPGQIAEALRFDRWVTESMIKGVQ